MIKNRKRTPTKVVDESSKALKSLAGYDIPQSELELRRKIGQYLIDPKKASLILIAEASVARRIAAVPRKKIEYPDGLEPKPVIESKMPDPNSKLKKADVLVITWTSAEQDALSDIFTPGYGRKSKHPKKAWYSYGRNFEKGYLPLIRRGAPARRANSLGNWMRTKIGECDVLCFKSELHLNQDGIRNKERPGTATLPVKDLFNQLLDEVDPDVVLTVGTSGGVFDTHDLGDVVITRAAKFRLQDEFKNEPFNHKTYYNEWNMPIKHLNTSVDLMKGFADNLAEPGFLPPTKRFPFSGPILMPSPKNDPDVKLDGVKLAHQSEEPMPKLHPILTTDYFEFGNSTNRLDREGCAVEMGDAVLGLVCSERENAPNWAIVRNVSDPVINGDLPTTPSRLNMQIHWAVWYYETYGYWTSFMGALATWGIIAGL